jgi:L-asparaginase/Glu-tRNA(Gln) amidotransferase subunit D
VSLGDLFDLADAISAALGEGFAGVVVIQGTDTIEETAYLLDLLVASEVPVVVTGSMRNPSLAGPDGPANILAAISVAASSCARGACRWCSPHGPAPELSMITPMASPGSETDLLARGLISAGYLAPLKARLLLYLLIATGADRTQIRQTFAAASGVS